VHHPVSLVKKEYLLVVPVLLTTIEGISHISHTLTQGSTTGTDREIAWKSVLEVQRRFPDGIALLDLSKHGKSKDEKFKALVKVV